MRDGEFRKKGQNIWGTPNPERIEIVAEWLTPNLYIVNSGALAPCVGSEQLATLGDSGLSIFQNQWVLTELYETSGSGDNSYISRDRF